MAAAAALAAAASTSSPAASWIRATGGGGRRASVVSMMMTDVVLQCSDGMQLAAQRYKNNTNHADADSSSSHRQKVLCLHGWMDNCRSFHLLAPALSEKLDCDVVALDLPGHGWSSHKSADGPPSLLAEGAFYVAEAIQQLEWNDAPFSLIGHSMGAGISCLYAAAFPEQVNKLVLLEGIGPLARNPTDVAKHVRMHVQRRQLGLELSHKPPRIYPSLEHAVQARCQTARNFPGHQYLSHDAATELVLRGSRPVAAEVDAGGSSSSSHGGGGVQYRHDPRLQWPSLQYFTPEQTEALYVDIQCPTAVLGAVDGWPFEESVKKRCLELLQPQLSKWDLPGSHHFHVDPDTAQSVINEVIDFLE